MALADRRIGYNAMKEFIKPFDVLRFRKPAEEEQKLQEFLPAALEILETPLSPIRVAFLWFLCAIPTVALIWAIIGFIDIHAVAPGRIQPKGYSKVVQSFDAGRVETILVEEGQQVKKDQLLAQLDDREASADLDRLKTDMADTQAEILRRRALVDAVRKETQSLGAAPAQEGIPASALQREWRTGEAELAQINAQIGSLLAQKQERERNADRLRATMKAREQLKTVQSERTSMREYLIGVNAGSRASLLDALQDAKRTELEQAADLGMLAEVESAKATIEQRLSETRAAFLTEQYGKINEAERRLPALQLEAVKAATRLERTRITSPIDGTVQQLALTTQGQSVGAGQALMVVVPADDTIEVTAFVANKDIGFIAEGQKVRLKIEAFPYTRYGVIEGTVTRIPRDAMDDRDMPAMMDVTALQKLQAAVGQPAKPKLGNLIYPVVIAPERTSITVYGREVRLSPGMAVTAEIQTGRRRLIEYFLSPFQEAGSEAVRER